MFKKFDKKPDEPLYQTIAKERVAKRKAAKKAKGEPMDDEDDEDGDGIPDKHDKHPSVSITIGGPREGGHPFGNRGKPKE
jgi:hypothetical protein